MIWSKKAKKEEDLEENLQTKNHSLPEDVHSVVVGEEGEEEEGFKKDQGVSSAQPNSIVMNMKDVLLEEMTEEIHPEEEEDQKI